MPADPAVLAEKIATRANKLLQPMQTEMDINQWPSEFRKIMWQAVADTAALLAADNN